MKKLFWFLVAFTVGVPLCAIVVPVIGVLGVCYLVFELVKSLLRFAKSLFEIVFENLIVLVRGYEKKRMGYYDYLDNRDCRENEAKSNGLNRNGKKVYDARLQEQ